MNIYPLENRPQTTLARNLAIEAHSNQTDLAGKPYSLHLTRVAERVGMHSDEVTATAWLHDIVEDTNTTLEDLRNHGFSETVISAVDALTQRPNEPLESYWTRVSLNKIAFIVKVVGDMPDNNDPARHVGLGVATSDRIRSKYVRAAEFFAGRIQGLVFGQ